MPLTVDEVLMLLGEKEVKIRDLEKDKLSLETRIKNLTSGVAVTTDPIKLDPGPTEDQKPKKSK